MRMRLSFAGLLFVTLFVPFRTACAQSKADPLIGTALTPNERRVIQHLLDDWNNEYSITGIDVAMAALGLQPSDAMRFHIGNHIKKHPELHEIVRQWGWQTLALTPN